ncbi:MAG: acyl-CoA dehydratase activase [Thermoanaerobaculia bacterium]|nr:acyl-CoA dehydratase activase [Thermoanaerobaculia bacterium]
MTITAGIDVGSTYTKGVLLSDQGEILARSMRSTGFLLDKAARHVFDDCRLQIGLEEEDCDYVIATGTGRHRVDFKDLAVTDLTSGARGARHLFPGTRTVLDIGGQTMKSSRLDDQARVQSFRLNDKCAAGTGAFLEKTARYMGYSTEDIGPLMATARSSVPISGVCAVFAESEVINHLSIGTPPGDIMQGAIESLTTRSVQLMKRIKAEPEFTLIGGILRFESMSIAVETNLGEKVNVPAGDLCQYTCAIGAGVLGHLRLARLGDQKSRHSA